MSLQTDSVDTSHSHRSNKASSKRAFSHSVNAPTSAWNWPGFASFGFGKAPPPMFSGVCVLFVCIYYKVLSGVCVLFCVILLKGDPYL